MNSTFNINLGEKLLNLRKRRGGSGSIPFWELKREGEKGEEEENPRVQLGARN